MFNLVFEKLPNDLPPELVAQLDGLLMRGQQYTMMRGGNTAPHKMSFWHVYYNGEAKAH